MEKINETITIKPNEGLEIDISRIRPEGETKLPISWCRLELGYAELRKHFVLDDEDYLRFTEDDLEKVIRSILETNLKTTISRFSWMWDKVRSYTAHKAA